MLASPVAVSAGPAPAGEQVITQVFRLSHEVAANLVPVLRPLIAPNNTVVAYPGNNSLVVTDYASNIARIAQIIASIDTPVANEVEVVPMVHALAIDVAVAVNRMLDEGARGGQPSGQPSPMGDASQRVTVYADTRLNSVMVRTTSPERMRLARSLIARLDVATSEPGNIHVVYLRNAEAVKLAQTLRGVLAGDGGPIDKFWQQPVERQRAWVHAGFEPVGQRDAVIAIGHPAPGRLTELRRIAAGTTANDQCSSGRGHHHSRPGQ